MKRIPFLPIAVFCSVFLICLFGQQRPLFAMYRCVGLDGVYYTDTMDSATCRPMTFRQDSIFENSSGGGSFAQYEKIINHYGLLYNVDPRLIRAVIRTESGFNCRAVSNKGAKGLMQLMPLTARELRVRNPFDPEENIEAGTRYLRMLLDSFDGDLSLALAAYNAGPTVVKRQRKVPMIAETQNYVKRVMSYYQLLKKGTA